MEKLESALNEILKTGKGKSLLLKLGAESYLEANIKTIQVLQKNGLSGVYVSIQRPFKNISSLLQKQSVNLNRLIFIDVASAVSKEIQEKCWGCVHISPKLDVDELVKAINASLEALEKKGKNKSFIFIDSLTTFALHQPISEILRFSEFLMRMAESEKGPVLIFNVAKDLSNRKYIQDAVAHADKVIEVNA